MKKLIATLILLLALSGGAKASFLPQTFVVDFEIPSIDSSSTIGHYYDATWVNFDVQDAPNYNTDYIPALHSGTHLAYNNFATTNLAKIIFDNPVNVEGAWFSAMYSETGSNIISISGTYGNGNEFELDPITVLPGTAQWNRFILKGATDDSLLTGVSTLQFKASSDWFTMDDLTYKTPVPEPASMALGLISLTGLLGARRKKIQAN
jgi:hypothetical protein